MINFNAYSAFIFDMDGTLVDNMPFHNRVWIDFLTEKGAQVDPETFNDRTAGKTNPEIFRMYLGAQFEDALLPVYSREKEVRYREAYRPHLQPVHGLLDFLTAARQAGIRLALATSAGQENIDYVLEHLAIAGAFQAVVNGEEVRHGKPDPEIFLEAAKRLGAAPNACLVFEDSRGGIEAARRAGMPAVVITTSMAERQALAIPGVAMAVQDFSQALDLFAQQGVLTRRSS